MNDVRRQDRLTSVPAQRRGRHPGAAAQLGRPPHNPRPFRRATVAAVVAAALVVVGWVGWEQSNWPPPPPTGTSVEQSTGK
ncbi:MAG: hypothetical protein ACOYX5_18775 [Actinomycetota bacterium]